MSIRHSVHRLFRRRPSFQILENRLAPATLLHTLFPDPAGPQFNGQFGFSEAISADYRIAGSPLVDTLGGNDSGQVFIYSAATNNLLWTLDNPTPAAMDRFGISVSISGQYLVVGADADDAGVAD